MLALVFDVNVAIGVVDYVVGMDKVGTEAAMVFYGAIRFEFFRGRFGFGDRLFGFFLDGRARFRFGFRGLESKKLELESVQNKIFKNFVV